MLFRSKPKGVMLLALINSICILVIMTLPEKQAPHAYVYFASYAGLVLLFYFINYNLGFSRDLPCSLSEYCATGGRIGQAIWFTLLFQ